MAAAVSCGEVMYGAYYPYLYGRGRLHHHQFHYDRFNVGGGNPCGGGEAYGAGAGAGAGGAGAGGSPAGSPHAAHSAHLLPARATRTKEEDLSMHSRSSNDGGGGGGSSESEGECGRAAGAGGVSGGAGGAGVADGGAGGVSGGGAARAQYVSANCVVFTHYSGDVSAVVDEHFARAFANDKHKESVPMASRNLPASFFNAHALGGATGLGGGGAGAGGGELYEYEWGGWGGTGYGYGSQYAGLLLPRGLQHYKPVEWAPPPLDAPYSYPPVHSQYHHHHHQRLEAQVQDSSKDLYWF